jgi:hypothetical protein
MVEKGVVNADCGSFLNAEIGMQNAEVFLIAKSEL